MLVVELLAEARRFAAQGLLPLEVARRVVALAQAQGLGAVYEVAPRHRVEIRFPTGERLICERATWRLDRGRIEGA